MINCIAAMLLSIFPIGSEKTFTYHNLANQFEYMDSLGEGGESAVFKLQHKELQQEFACVITKDRHEPGNVKHHKYKEE